MLYRLTLWMKLHQLRKAIRRRQIEQTVIHLVELGKMLTDDDFAALFSHPCSPCFTVGDTLHQCLLRKDTAWTHGYPMEWLTGLTAERVAEYRDTLLFGIVRQVWYDVLTPLRTAPTFSYDDRCGLYTTFTHIEAHLTTVIRSQHGIRKSKGRRGHGLKMGR